MKVLVVGAGPAGLACAESILSHNVRKTFLERLRNPSLNEA